MKLKSALSVLSSLLFAKVETIPTCSGTDRYCHNNVFTSYVDFDTNKEIRQEWKMFEGSIALTQVGVFWKEYSTAAGD